MATKNLKGSASRRSQILTVLALALAGCASGDDNSPSMGKVAPKPNPNMSAQLPPDVREQMSHASVGADASAMQKMKPHH